MVALTAAACDRLSSPPSAPTIPAPQAPVDTRKVTYELQEKCARDAYELYKHEWADKPQGNLRTISLSYTNHYNSKLGKCLMVVTFLYADATKGKITDYQSQDLVDVLENREIGAFLSPMKTTAQAFQCYVAEQTCSNTSAVGAPASWERLAKPYMEE